jgi:hypothetical protein
MLSPVTTIKALREKFHYEPLLDEPKPLAPQLRLLDLLSLARINLASDPRDKVYSFLGLSRGDEIAKSIVPDYSETNTSAVLYRDVAAKFIEAGLGPSLLQHAGLDQKIPNLPSWVPDWTYQSRSTINPHLYICSGNSVPSLRLSKEEPKKLFVRGAILDTIRVTGMAWRYFSTSRSQEKFDPFKDAPSTSFPPFTDEDSRCVIRTMAKKFTKEKQYCWKLKPSENLDDALARTLVMDCTWRGQRTASDSEFLGSFKAFERLYGAGRQEDTPPSTKIHISGIFHWVWNFTEEEEEMLRRASWPFEAAFQKAHKGRSFCATERGYMCTAPYNTERGDVIVLLEGISMPFVLRKEGESDEWKVVGDAYVHGIMDGELLTKLEGGEARDDEISRDGNGEEFVVRLGDGLASFREFCVV